MKYLIISIHIIVISSSLVAMEENQPKQENYIIIKNQINDKNSPKQLSSDIYISDEVRQDILWGSKDISLSSTAIKLPAGKSVQFAPSTRQGFECTRLGMNDNNSAALIAIYVTGAIKTKDRIVKLFIGNNSPIKFKDTITFSHKEPDDYIIMSHNNQPLRKMPFQHIVETYGKPENYHNEGLLMVVSNKQ
jgi:hypothetical protein